MKFLPKSWNDTLSIVPLVGYPIFILIVAKSGLEKDIVLLLIGGFLPIITLVAQYFYRKAPPDGGTTK